MSIMTVAAHMSTNTNIITVTAVPAVVMNTSINTAMNAHVAATTMTMIMARKKK